MAAKRVNKLLQKKVKKRAGRKLRKHIVHGLINKVIAFLPFELYLPSFQYCHRRTRLEVRLARGDPVINMLDADCKERDIAYGQRNPELKRVADKNLYRKDMQRVSSLNATVAEKIVAHIVVGAMKGKLLLDGGFKQRRQ